MRSTNLATSLCASIATALAFCAMLSACNGPAASLSSSVLPPSSREAAPVKGSAPTPIPFKFETVNDPNSDNNQVMGINQLGKIVGTFGAGAGSDIAQSYAAQPPYPKFLGMDYPGAQGTTATSLTSNKIVAGYVINPPQLPGIWAFVRVRGLWYLMKDRDEGKGKNAVTEILGISDSEIAVGYYLNDKDVSVPFVLNAVTQQFTTLKPPGAVSAEATGIDGKGNIVGFETLSSGRIVGFFLNVGTYYQIAYPNARATEALSLNWQNQLVGRYQDSHKHWHGFVLTYPMNGGAKQIWQRVNEPHADGETVVTGINNHDAICGWYVDAAGHTDGFVAKPQ